MNTYRNWDEPLPMMARTLVHLPVTLSFVESEDRYSVYTDPDGETVYLRHGDAFRMVAFDLDDRIKLAATYVARVGYLDLDDFLNWWRSQVIDPEEVEDIELCTCCNDPEHVDDLYGTANDGSVCESCEQSHYSRCYDCEESYRDEQVTSIDDESVCERCRNRLYHFCDACDDYVRDNDDDHFDNHDSYDDDDERDGDCDSNHSRCEPEGTSFTMRNDGLERLANDTRATVSLPAGVISEEGLNTIRNYLYQYGWNHTGTDEQDEYGHQLRLLSYRVPELGDKWQAKDGNYTKRLSRFAYKEFQVKILPEILSHVGNIASAHSVGKEYQVEFTRNLNLPREDFAHPDSCWWTSYSRSRCSLKSNGGIGLRTFTENDWGTECVSGRAWVMPLRRFGTEGNTLVSTFDTVTPDAFVVFNGYGDMEGYAPARIMSHMTGMTYRKITFYCEPMYINNSSGYLIAPEEIAAGYTDGTLTLNQSAHSNLFNTESKELTHV